MHGGGDCRDAVSPQDRDNLPVKAYLVRIKHVDMVHLLMHDISQNIFVVSSVCKVLLLGLMADFFDSSASEFMRNLCKLDATFKLVLELITKLCKFKLHNLSEHENLSNNHSIMKLSPALQPLATVFNIPIRPSRSPLSSLARQSLQHTSTTIYPSILSQTHPFSTTPTPLARKNSKAPARDSRISLSPLPPLTRSIFIQT